MTRRALLSTCLTLLAALPMTAPSRAQDRPRISPHERVEQIVDGSRIEIVYGRPSMRGRTIFGRLVPYGKVWCPGADEATTLNSAKELLLGGLRVPPGPHTVWMLPTADRWTLIISKDPSGFHTRYYPARDLGHVELRKEALDHPVEQLTFAITPTTGGGEVAMLWERTRVSVPFTVVR